MFKSQVARIAVAGAVFAIVMDYFLKPTLEKTIGHKGG